MTLTLLPDQPGAVSSPPPGCPAALPGGGDLFPPEPLTPFEAPAAAGAGELLRADVCDCCGLEVCIRDFEQPPLEEPPAPALEPPGVPRVTTDELHVHALAKAGVKLDELPIAEAFALAHAGMVTDGRDPAGAVEAFVARRFELNARHGPRAVTAPARPARDVARDLRERLSAITDRLQGRHPSAENLELALGTTATLGALALSLFDAIAAELAATPAERD